METFKQRLDFALKQRGLIPAEFARKMGVEPQSITHWKARGGIPRTKFTKAIQILRVNALWLADGTGEWNKVAGITSLTIRHTVNDPTGDYAVQLETVPLISSVTAGHWSDIVDNFAPNDVEQWITTNERVSTKAFALKIQGDSMQPQINDGDIIIVDPAIEPRHKNIVVVRQNNDTEATCKRLMIEGGTYYLKPDNERYPIMQMDNDAVICGVAVGLSKSLI